MLVVLHWLNWSGGNEMDEEFNDYKKNRKKINCLLKNHSEMINIIDDGIVKSCKSASEEVFR